MSLTAIVQALEHAPEGWDAETRLVALALAETMGDHDGVLSSWPKVSTLTTRTGLSDSTVRRRIQNLEHSGWIEIRSRYRGGRQASNLYLWIGPRSALPQEVSSGLGPVSVTGRDRPRSVTADRPRSVTADRPRSVTADRAGMNHPLEPPENQVLAPSPREPVDDDWALECEHGAPHDGRGCIDCRTGAT